ncbi:MAG: DUF2848 domain-containing protein [Alphaproteobacteria bacterium]|nr:DUF2848 domain-containing protein [Alphaproteobacteria bacterium]
MPITLEFTIEPEGTAKQVRIDDLVIAGWTGRNVDALEKHIVELEELGVQGMLIGVGSDHTDREVETYSVPVSKQMCLKPVSRSVWRYSDVADHFDDILLRGWATENGEKNLYQDGGVTAMRPPEELIGLYLPGETTLPSGMAMYCGTLAAIGGIRPAERFDVEIEDPKLGRKISYGYNVNTLPVVT